GGVDTDRSALQPPRGERDAGGPRRGDAEYPPGGRQHLGLDVPILIHLSKEQPGLATARIETTSLPGRGRAHRRAVLQMRATSARFWVSMFAGSGIVRRLKRRPPPFMAASSAVCAAAAVRGARPLSTHPASATSIVPTIASAFRARAGPTPGTPATTRRCRSLGATSLHQPPW